MSEDEEKKFFDVSRPNHTAPDATGKPVIVGHHPQMPDPMIIEETDGVMIPVSVGPKTQPQVADAQPAQPQNMPALGDVSAPHQNNPSLAPVAAVSAMDFGSNTIASDKAQAAEPIGLAPTTTAGMTANNNMPAPNNIPQNTPQTTTEPILSPPASSTLLADDQSAQLPPGTIVSREQDPVPPNDPLDVPAGHASYKNKPRAWVWALLALVVMASIYAGLDAKTDIMPFHIFSHSSVTPSQTSATVTTPPATPTPQPTKPSGYDDYQPVGTTIVFSYPTKWGTPTTTKDSGYSKRGASQKSDGTHAYIVNFSKNKDVQIAITSSKYLPTSRTAMYYDFLQWCKGTNDGKIYKSTLSFTTSGGIDTPGTVICNTGPLTDATKITDFMIVQQKTKDVDGKTLGNVYSVNLRNASDLSVLRAKDATMANSKEVEKLIDSLSAAPAQ